MSEARANAPRVIASVEDAERLIGVELGPSGPLTVEQGRIDAFADATGDHQWIHVDAERAAAGPFGATIAHGYLTLSLIPQFAPQLYSFDFGDARLNYGANKIRFPQPVPVGSVLRASAKLIEVRRAAQGVFVTAQFTIAADGAAKPACVAEVMTLVTGA